MLQKRQGRCAKKTRQSERNLLWYTWLQISR